MSNLKNFLYIFTSIVALFLTGCSSLTNLTPQRLPENQSGVYTISMSAYINDGTLVKGSIKPYIVIDGEHKLMKKVDEMEGRRIYEYDYRMPKGRTNAKYYFELKYLSASNVNNAKNTRDIVSPTIYTLTPASRYIVNMQNERGPVGSSIPVLGRGFDQADRIKVGDVFADTQYLSRSTLNFKIPPVESNKVYDVVLIGENNSRLWIGQLKVDTADMQVSPSTLDMVSGDINTMIFDIGFTAPAGGYPIDVRTNIPSSLIMEEVVVPEGESSVTATIKSAAVGKGMLYINALGFREKLISINVTASDSQESVLDSISNDINEIEISQGQLNEINDNQEPVEEVDVNQDLDAQ